MFKLCILADLGFEVWQNVPGYNGRYKISSYGRVWDVKKNRELPQFINDRGYKIVHLRYERIDKKTRVHRLVAEAFVPKKDKRYDQVNHKDEKKWADINNHCENLEWCDCKYNINYGTGIQRRSKKLKASD